MNCESLTDAIMPDIVTSNVTTLQGAFWGSDLLTNVVATGWNTTNVANWIQMFYSVDNIKSVSGIDTWRIQSVPAGGFGNTFQAALLYTEPYSDMLVNFDSQPALAVDPNLQMGSATYNDAGSVARSNLVSEGWTITDGGYN